MLCSRDRNWRTEEKALAFAYPTTFSLIIQALLWFFMFHAQKNQRAAEEVRGRSKERRHATKEMQTLKCSQQPTLQDTYF